MQNQVIYNLTLKITHNLSEAWLEDMESRVLPACFEKDLVISTQIAKIMIEDNEDHTFAIQFVFPSEQVFYQQGKGLFKKMVVLLDEKFRGKYVYFTTMMEVIHSSRNTG